METLIKIIKTLISFFKKKDNVIENLEKEEKIMEDKKEDSLDITFEKSPNYNSREGEKISLVVLHWTAGKFKGSLSWLKDKRAQASAHYVISKEGKIVQIVKEEDKAWHCGYSYLKGYASDLNKCSIGIEMEGPPSMIEEGGWTDEIINACINLLKDIKKRYPDIKLTDHSTVAPNRKTDVRKGTSIDEFPWEKVVTESEIPVA